MISLHVWGGKYMGKFSLSGAMSRVTSTLSSAPSKINQSVNKGVGSFQNSVGSSSSSVPKTIDSAGNAVTSKLSGVGSSFGGAKEITSGPGGFLKEKLGGIKSDLTGKLSEAMDVDMSKMGLDQAMDTSQYDFGDLSQLQQFEGMNGMDTTIPNVSIPGANMNGTDINSAMAKARNSAKQQSDQVKKELENAIGNNPLGKLME